MVAKKLDSFVFMLSILPTLSSTDEQNSKEFLLKSEAYQDD